MKKVLIVEDNPDMRELLTLYIQLMGLSAITARDGTEGVEKAIRENPNLILMDVMLPRVDGREATRILRSNPQTQTIPILAATALARESELKECLDAGCNDCLTKPFSFKQLEQKIREFIT